MRPVLITLGIDVIFNFKKNGFYRKEAPSRLQMIIHPSPNIKVCKKLFEFERKKKFVTHTKMIPVAAVTQALRMKNNNQLPNFSKNNGCSCALHI